MKNSFMKGNKLRLISLNIIIILMVIFSLLSLGKYKVVTVDPIAMNVRTGPSIDFDIKSQVKKGDKLTILEEKNHWYRVKFNDNDTGWVASWLVSNKETSPATNIAAKINTPKTNLREDPTTESKKIATLDKQTKVTITKEQHGWSYVTVDNKEGWVFSQLLNVENNKQQEKDLSSETLFARQDGTKIRTEPSIDSQVLTTLGRGEKIHFLENDGDWYQVKTANGQKGYVANWVVSFGKPNKHNKITSIAETTIVLDPGHGGYDAGSLSNDERIYEKNVTLKTALAVEKELKSLGANVIMTRRDDSFISLSGIAGKSNRAKADVFISFHFDSSQHPNEASGTTTYYYNEKDIPLAETVNSHIKQELPLTNRGTEFGDYQVLRDNHQPALLLELGYMNNDGDAYLINSKDYQKKVALAVKNALMDYFE